SPVTATGSTRRPSSVWARSASRCARSWPASTCACPWSSRAPPRPNWPATTGPRSWTASGTSSARGWQPPISPTPSAISSPAPGTSPSTRCSSAPPSNSASLAPLPPRRALAQRVLGRDDNRIHARPAIQRRGCLVAENPGGAVVGCQRLTDRGQQLAHPRLGPLAGEVDGHRLVDHKLLDGGRSGEVEPRRDPLTDCLFAGVA